MTTSRIVVGVDGSPASVDALRWAARQALTGGTLETIVSWQYPVQYDAKFSSEAIDWPMVAQSALGTALAEGHPVQVLLDTSAAADLLVVGSRVPEAVPR